MVREQLQQNYESTLERIAAAARAAGRNPDEIRLVVVTKGHPVEALAEVIAAGARRLGENYVEEALEKIDRLRQADLVAGVEFHMIGQVQSRKARPVAEQFDWVHSVDRLKLATRLDSFAAEFNRRLPVLLECNVSGEASKSGWPAWDETQWPQLADQIAPLLELPNLVVGGLMTMAPYFDDPEAARPSFRRLKRLQDFFAQRLPDADWSRLSMGMSGDFEAAIQEGSTLVRIGTAIMGPRPARKPA